MNNNKDLIQSVLVELYEKNNWPDLIDNSTPNVIPSNIEIVKGKGNYIKIDAPGKYKNLIYYGTNNTGENIQEDSLFLQLFFVGYSVIDGLPVFKIGKNITILRASFRVNKNIAFLNEPSLTVSDVFNEKNNQIVDSNIVGNKLIPISTNIKNSPSIIKHIEDHIRGM